MAESSQMLRQKTSELETAVVEVQRELARADRTRRSEAHDRLATLVREAREWLEARSSREGESDDVTADTRRAEALLHEIRMGRAEL